METHDKYVAQFNKGLKQIDKNPSRALTYFKKIQKELEFKELYINMGVAYKNLGRYEEAAKAMMKADDPKLPMSDDTYMDVYPLACRNLGLIAYINEQDEEAIRLYQRALLNNDDDPATTKFNYSLAKLRRYCSNKDDQLEFAWKLYDYRFKRANASKLKIDNPNAKIWDFKTRVDKIFVAVEQGFGDAFMFARYLPFLESFANEIIVQANVPAFAGIYKYETRFNASDSGTDWVVPAGSLGRLSPNIPSGEWLSHLYVPKERSDTLEILGVFKGNNKHINDSNRSVAPGYFNRLRAFGNVRFLDVPATWMETIKYLEGIDLVITVDTSIAHLCGSLGKPCWVMMPLADTDFRWGDSSIGYNNIWYSSVSVIRNPGSWEKTFDTVVSCLK